MEQEQGARAGSPAPRFADLRAKPSVARNLIVFIKTKPLGAFGGFVALLLIIIAILAPQIATKDHRTTNPDHIYAPPSSELLFGGDELGRDVFSRLVMGSRISLTVGLISALIGCSIGMLVGVTSAYFGGITDLLVQRLIDGMIAFPALVLIIAIVAALGSSLNNVVIALSILFVPITARIVRSQALAIKEMDYVLAAQALGAREIRIIFRHMLPNTLAIVLVILTFQLGVAIIAEASLSFLGLGAGPDEPSWGRMLEGATKRYVGIGPWLAVFPGAAIAIVVFSWNVLGDSLRDILDPRLRGTR